MEYLVNLVRVVVTGVGARQCCMNEKDPNLKVLGIETSFDETAAAIVTEDRRILSECLKRQSDTHNRWGGLTPWIANSLHEQAIDRVIETTVDKSGLQLQDLDAIAVTTRPGLVNCLTVGAQAALKLSQRYQKPLICVHHMRAHALTARFIEPRLQYPFLCLLMSGGHCILCLIRGVEDFVTMGETRDNSPGGALDKIARRLRLKHYSKELCGLSGGESVERMASKGDPRALDIHNSSLQRHPDCTFSFSAILTKTFKLIEELEEEEGIRGFGFVRDIHDLCASVQHTIFRHLAKRLQRAIEIADHKGHIPLRRKEDERILEEMGSLNSGQDQRVIVLSGGVAANQYICTGLRYVAARYGYDVIVPPPQLCTDNGVMIAWNALETYRNSLSEQILSSDNIAERNDVQDSRVKRSGDFKHGIISPEFLSETEAIWVDGKSPLGTEDMKNDIKDLRWTISHKFSINKPYLFESINQ